MASNSRVVIPLVIGAVVLVAAAAGFFVFSGQGGADDKIVEFINQPMQLPEEVDSLDSPRESGNVAAHLRKGVSVDVVGIVDGRKWAQVTLPDKRTAYVPARLIQAAPAPSPPTATVPAPPPAPSGEISAQFGIDQANKVEFDTTSDVYMPDKPVPVYVEPNSGAPEKYEIEPGTGVPAIARSKDGGWIMASTEDGSPAFLPAADLGQPRPGKVLPASLALPDTVDGTATVDSTSNIEVGGRQVTLAGIEGESGSYAKQLQSIVDSQGGTLHCERQDEKYTCKLNNGMDIAVSALFNGGAKPTADAPAQYQSQAKAAQREKRGIWATAN